MRVIGLAVVGLMLALGGAQAQTSAAEKDKLSDAERAKRDADKVFSFIKFHTVKPAAAAPAAKPAAPAAATNTAANGAASAPAPAPQVATRSLGAGTTEEPKLHVDAVESPVDASAAALLASAPKLEPEEVPLQLVNYVPPDMTPQVLAAMPTSLVTIPVRFTVQTSGQVSAAAALGGGPRKVQQAAVRAVQQWRFAPIPAVREVDVEIAFRAE